MSNLSESVHVIVPSLVLTFGVIVEVVGGGVMTTILDDEVAGDGCKVGEDFTTDFADFDGFGLRS